MSPGDLDKLKSLFDRFDRDRSGAIEASELGSLLEAFASGTSERVLAALASLDTAQPDRVTWDEFRTWWTGVVVAQHDRSKPDRAGRAAVRHRAAPQVATGVGPGESERDLREIFSRFDRDRSGSIDARELGALLEALGKDPDDDDLRALFNRFDTDHNGRISFDELRVWWEEEA
jgi:Ca2+-binding EF-hand superfamily protein